MVNSRSQTIRPSRFSAAQRRALDLIGHALKHRKIDFNTAAELSDRVKEGRLDEIPDFLELDLGNEAN